eukprot:Opistho-1_new@19666
MPLHNVVRGHEHGIKLDDDALHKREELSPALRLGGVVQQPALDPQGPRGRLRRAVVRDINRVVRLSGRGVVHKHSQDALVLRRALERLLHVHPLPHQNGIEALLKRQEVRVHARLGHHGLQLRRERLVRGSLETLSPERLGLRPPFALRLCCRGRRLRRSGRLGRGRGRHGHWGLTARKCLCRRRALLLLLHGNHALHVLWRHACGHPLHRRHAGVRSVHAGRECARSHARRRRHEWPHLAHVGRTCDAHCRQTARHHHRLLRRPHCAGWEPVAGRVRHGRPHTARSGATSEYGLIRALCELRCDLKRTSKTCALLRLLELTTVGRNDLTAHPMYSALI